MNKQIIQNDFLYSNDYLKTPISKHLLIDDSTSFIIPSTPISNTKIPFSRISTPGSIFKSINKKNKSSPQYFSPLLLSDQKSKMKQNIIINDDNNCITISNNDSNPPLLTNKPLLHFGGIKTNENINNSIILKNNTNEDIDIKLKIVNDNNDCYDKNGFTLLCHEEEMIKQNDIKEIEILFEPKTQNEYVSVLNIELEINDTIYKYMIPLHGYGGVSNIDVFLLILVFSI